MKKLAENSRKQERARRAASNNKGVALFLCYIVLNNTHKHPNMLHIPNKCITFASELKQKNMGKLIYQPKGKAREYSPWACNLYNGCSNRCTYCYNRKGVACKLLGKDEVTPKKDAYVDMFDDEIAKYKDKILADGKGLFFNFVSDPFLPETWKLNYQCANQAIEEGVPCVFLSKRVPTQTFAKFFLRHKDMVKVGFTLTGCDDLEPGADTNEARINAIRSLSHLKIKTWASIEPVIYIDNSYRMIQQAYIAGCREFKIGLLSGKKTYTPEQVEHFKSKVITDFGATCNILWKESVLNYINEQ